MQALLVIGEERVRFSGYRKRMQTFLGIGEESRHFGYRLGMQRFLGIGEEYRHCEYRRGMQTLWVQARNADILGIGEERREF